MEIKNTIYGNFKKQVQMQPTALAVFDSKKKVHDKVKRCGLSPMKSPLVNAPYFSELPVTMECELLRIDPEEDEISERILGTVKNVSIDEQVLKEDKKTLDFSKLHPVCWDNFSNDYFAVGEKLGQWFTLGKVFK
ncbi:MAG TPA: hypothetical protein K8W09_02185 [Parabacteroides johnsonii]|uniref:hypothetical protein n=1 Tax=Parabacteroides johnsonii TaxID=387661 RepID=UPI001DF09AF9|nr:hypothetical protein [Parabacteroides johnsonii]HJG98069.1 hypothetical protein [Parabacteroides johnsonii]